MIGLLVLAAIALAYFILFYTLGHFHPDANSGKR